MKNNKKTILKVAGILAATAGTSYFILGNAFYYVTLTRSGMENKHVAKIASGTKQKDADRLRLDEIKKQGKEWFDNAKKEKLVIKSTNRNKKFLYLVPALIIAIVSLIAYMFAWQGIARVLSFVVARIFG